MSDYKNILREHLKANNLTTSIGEISEFHQIGEGGNGLVFKANLHGKTVAVKFLTNYTEDKLQRFKAEYFNILTLPTNHYVARSLFYDEFEIQDVKIPAIGMEKYDGSLKRPDKITIDNFMNLFNFLLDSVEFIHSNGIVHRDLKPENILFDSERFILSDFGIAYFDSESFELKAITKKGERLGNRLFSPPEQEKGKIDANPTMDIFAIGQICQWFCTNEIHRGTNRTKITETIPEAGFYDRIIEKCLAHNPEARYQTVFEIREAIKTYRKPRERVYPYEFLRPFGTALGATFPKGLHQASFSNDKKIIDRLINNIITYCNFERNLWWLDGERANLNFQFSQLDDNSWLMGDGRNGDEVSFSSVWAYHSTSYYDDLILLNLTPMKPFGIYEETDFGYEEAGLVDDNFYVSRIEYDSGFAEINDEVINLSEHKTSLRCRYLKERSIVLTTPFHCAFHRESEPYIIKFLSEHNGGQGITHENFLNLVRTIRYYKHQTILETL